MSLCIIDELQDKGLDPQAKENLAANNHAKPHTHIKSDRFVLSQNEN